MTAMRISRVQYDVTTLGPGRRTVLWVNGCTLACPGCLAKDTWAADPDSAVPVASVLEHLTARPADGITISGGEPFEQYPELAELTAGLAAWRADRPVDVLVYSGYTWSVVRDRARRLAACDAVITGRYLRDRDTGTTPLRGSTNQRINPVTALGESRYRPYLETTTTRPPQVSQSGGRVWITGVPRPGELERLRLRLRRHGIGTTEETWS